MEKQKEFAKDEVASYFSSFKKVKVVFKKKDGSTRTMSCTNNLSLIPEEHRTKPRKAGDKPARKTPEHLFVVFDLEVGGWRSFAITSVISVEGV